MQKVTGVAGMRYFRPSCIIIMKALNKSPAAYVADLSPPAICSELPLLQHFPNDADEIGVCFIAESDIT